MIEMSEIIDLIRYKTGYEGEIGEQSSLQDDLDIYGDELSDVLQDYALEFNVNMGDYLWYFHIGKEEGFNLGAWFFKPPTKRVTEIPITLHMLHQFAVSGVWSVDYPEHQLPKYRIDIIINRIISISLLLLVFLLPTSISIKIAVFLIITGFTSATWKKH